MKSPDASIQSHAIKYYMRLTRSLCPKGFPSVTKRYPLGNPLGKAFVICEAYPLGLHADTRMSFAICEAYPLGLHAAKAFVTSYF
jgi:hypothetical protein